MTQPLEFDPDETPTSVAVPRPKAPPTPRLPFGRRIMAALSLLATPDQHDALELWHHWLRLSRTQRASLLQMLRTMR